MEFCLGRVASVSALLLCHYRSNLPPPMLWNQGWMSHGSSDSKHRRSSMILCKARTTQRLMNPHLDGHCYAYKHVVHPKCLFLSKSAYAPGFKTNRWPAPEGLGKASGLISQPNIRWERFAPWPFFTAGSVSTPWTPLNRAAYAGWLNAPRWGPSSAPPST